MIGLIKKDMLLMRKSIICFMVISLLCICTLPFVYSNMIAMLGIPLITCAFGLFIFQCFDYDNKKNWSIGLGVMPISKKQIVTERFIILFILCFIGTICALLYTIIFMQIRIVPNNFEPYSFILLGTLMCLCIGGIYIPCAYYFKGKNMEFALFITVIVATQVMSLSYNLMKIFTEVRDMNGLNIFFGMMLFLLLYISHKLSYHFYLKNCYKKV